MRGFIPGAATPSGGARRLLASRRFRPAWRATRWTARDSIGCCASWRPHRAPRFARVSSAAVEHAIPAGTDAGDGRAATVVIDTDGVIDRIEAAFVLDCSGRAGVIARTGLRRVASPHRTIALAGVWRAREWPGCENTHTLVALVRGRLGLVRANRRRTSATSP